MFECFYVKSKGVSMFKGSPPLRPICKTESRVPFDRVTNSNFELVLFGGIVSRVSKVLRLRINGW